MSVEKVVVGLGLLGWVSWLPDLRLLMALCTLSIFRRAAGGSMASGARCVMLVVFVVLGCCSSVALLASAWVVQVCHSLLHEHLHLLALFFS